jgi:transposase InsO family protein
MPFTTKSIMEQRLEFAILANQNDSNISRLCRRYCISRPTGYKWLDRYFEQGPAGLTNKSRRPMYSPEKTNEYVEKYIIELREENPEWGPKKLHKILSNHKEKKLYKYPVIPCKTTISKILKRNGLINQELSKQNMGFERFEYDYPNELWQMDFKGYFSLLNRMRCHPLTIIDDHSRFNLCLKACEDQKWSTVKQTLIDVFREYGMPYKILTDNGSPWGSAGNETDDGNRSITKLEKWLIQLNVWILHGRPYHPQTQGKDERFHKTLDQELLKKEQFRDYSHCQKRFDYWREKYNCIRPHEAIDFNVPINLYKPSLREYPEKIAAFEYNKKDIIRKVHDGGRICFMKRNYRVGKAFTGDYVAIRESDQDGTYNVYFCNQLIKQINL